MSLPSVTEVLRAVGLIDATWFTDEGRERGSAVHRLIEADHYRYLDEIPDAYEPYVRAYRRFVVESGHEPLITEVTLRHPVEGYVGHADRIGWLAGQRCLLDFKTGALGAVEPQLGGYRLAWQAMYPAAPIVILGAVALRADGSYRFHEIEPARAEAAWLRAWQQYREEIAA